MRSVRGELGRHAIVVCWQGEVGGVKMSRAGVVQAVARGQVVDSDWMETQADQRIMRRYQIHGTQIL